MRAVTSLVLLAAAVSLAAQAPDHVRRTELSVAAGFNIGASSPLGIPAEIRRIDSWRPALNLSVGAYASRMFSTHWGAGIGLVFENKGMKTGIEARNYHLTMNIIQGEVTGTKTGYYTGKIRNETRIAYITVPVYARYRAGHDWTVFAGPYFSLAVNRSFVGSVSEGKMREDPLHPAIGVGKADYNYSADIRRFDTGLSAGVSRRVWRDISVRGALQWGMLSTLDPSVRKIDMNTYNIYLNIAVSYTFR